MPLAHCTASPTAKPAGRQVVIQLLGSPLLPIHLLACGGIYQENKRLGTGGVMKGSGMWEGRVPGKGRKKGGRRSNWGQATNWK